MTTNLDLSQMSKQQLQQLIEQKDAEMKQLREAKRSAITFKVSAKGGVSIYGLNARFPVTLYGSQWERLIESIPSLVQFIDANRNQISVKPPTKTDESTI